MSHVASVTPQIASKAQQQRSNYHKNEVNALDTINHRTFLTGNYFLTAATEARYRGQTATIGETSIDNEWRITYKLPNHRPVFNDGIYDDMVTVVVDLLVTSNQSEIINLVPTYVEAGRIENKFRRRSTRVIK